MPKYIIILSSDEQIPDDEFQNKINQLLKHSDSCDELQANDFAILEAMNLEGIREELWKKKEELKTNISQPLDELDTNDQIFESTFEDIKELFKLD